MDSDRYDEPDDYDEQLEEHMRGTRAAWLRDVTAMLEFVGRNLRSGPWRVVLQDFDASIRPVVDRLPAAKRGTWRIEYKQ